MNVFTNFWYNMVNIVQTATALLVIVGGLAGVFVIVFFSILKLRKRNASLAIIISTLLSCTLMVPVISSFNNLVKFKIEGAIIDGGRAEIRAQRAEIERLKAENRIRALERERLDNQITIAKQSIEMEALNDQIQLLEYAQLSMQSFQKILELALLQTNLKQTLVRKDPLNSPSAGGWFGPDYYYDEVLVIVTHDIIAKFGVNLNEVRIALIDGNTAVVSGIRPTFIGTSRNIADTLVKEIRRVNIKNNTVDSVVVQNNRNAMQRADNYANSYETDFQTRLSEGMELGFMDDAVIQLAENFIRVMLAPLYRNIRFDTVHRPNALPLMEYLQKELKESNDLRVEMREANAALALADEKLEIEITEGEQNLSGAE